MHHVSKQIILTNRRAVSQIIGSLIVLAIVASIGSVILFQGLNQINAFNQDLSFHDREHNEALREDLIFEHVRFDPATNDLILYLANVGSIDSTVASLTVFAVDSQELVLSWEDIDKTINIEDHVVIHKNATLTKGNMTWSDDNYWDKDHKISITTSKGNFFSTLARPPNT